MNTYIANLTAFTFFSANLSKLLPGVPLSEHPDYFSETGRYHRMAHDRRYDERAMKSLGGVAPFGGTPREPGVIATFHIGAYKLLPLWLINCGVPLTLLVSADIAAKERGTYRTMASRFAAGVQPPLEILEAEDPTVIRKMIRSINRGSWVLVFLDGNVGAATKRSAGHKDLLVDFLAHRLRVKTGVAELGYLSPCPIYPMALLFDEQLNPKVMDLPPLDSSAGVRQDVVRETMETLYAWLARMIQQFPAQWEGWFYIHHDLQHRDGTDHRTLLQQFLPFAVGDHRFVLHRQTYDAYPASNRVFRKLCEFYSRHVLRNS